MRSFAVALGVVAALTSSRAYAAPTEDECAASYERTQRTRKSGHLLDAEREAITCASESCPAALRDDCVRWLGEVRRAQPSVVVTAKDRNACTIADARVFVDGTLRSEHLDGRPLVVDPGEHQIRVVPATGAPIEERLLLTEGDAAHRLDASLAPPNAVCGATATPTPSAETSEQTRKRSAYIIGGIGLAGIGLGGLFELAGFVRESKLDDCKPRCSPGDVRGMRAIFATGDVLIGAGLVTVAVGAYLLFATKKDSASTATLLVPGGMRF